MPGNDGKNMSMNAGLVRVVVPAHGAELTLRECVSSILQNLSGYFLSCEIVVVDDGDNGSIKHLLAGLRVQVVNTDARNAAIARNTGAAGFTGDILVFIDADVKLDAGAIPTLLKSILDGKADATFGNYSRNVAGLNFFQQYKQLYISRIYSRKHENLKYFFWTAIGAVKADVFREMGEFNPDLPGGIGEDIEFGQSLTRHDKTVIMVPNATGRHLKEYRFFSLVANDFKKGVSSVYLSLHNSVSVTSNPHATRIDAISAIYSFLGLMVFLLLQFAPLPISAKPVAATSLLFPYMWLRREFIAIQVKESALFAMRALPVMYFLDIIRIVSVLAGLAVYAASITKTR
jgi:glycosyltransferase involved in cell wall biosynthesis